VNRVADLTRQETFQVLTWAMGGMASPDRLGFRHRAGHVRTFALEVNLPIDADPIEKVNRVAASLQMRMKPTADAALAVLEGDLGGVFVDVADPRVWLIHTTGPSAWLEPLLAKAVSKSADIDWCWLPLSLIRAMQQEGRTRWFKSDFRGDELLPADGVAARRLKIQLEGDDAERLRSIIASLPEYETAASLTGVTIEIVDHDIGTLRAAAHYRGGFTGAGSSFELHQGFVSRAIGSYAESVRGAEANQAFRWSFHEDDARATFEGGTIEIRLGRPIDNLDHFAAGIFSSREPFRLWATPTRVSDGLIEAEVADLHLGQTFKVDVTRSTLRLYLREGVCANSVFRLLTNLQHRYDATAHAVASRGSVAIA
jgi:hypothetical protein